MSVSNPANPILAAWSATLARRGAEAAILAADGSRLRTFREVESEAVELAGLLRGCVSPGVVAIQMGNDPRLPALLLALWRHRLIPVLFDLSLERESLANAIATSHAAALIARRDGHLAISATPMPAAPPPDADFLKLTSGTTGAPRAIRFTAAQLLADCEAVCDTMGITAADVNFGVIPWSHSYGFSNLVTPLLCRGVSLVATGDSLPRAILNGLAHSGATVFPGLPVFFQKLAELHAPLLPHLRLCISAGAPLPAATARAFREKFGVKIHGFYGSSECGGIAYDATPGETPEGCVGAPMRGVRLEFESESDPSRISVHGAAVGGGYFPDSDASLTPGRFAPGDLVRRTPHGIVLAGRVSDFINVAGRKLNPAEIETTIRACPGVRDVVVFGVASALRGEEPVACVCGTANAAALQAHCANALPAWQVPRDFWLVESLPVSERGKLSRSAIAEAYGLRPRG